jgi:hypothetical protein
MLLAPPKLSFVPAQPDILITRKGYAFQHTGRFMRTAAEELEANCSQILRRLIEDGERGRHYSQNSLQALGLGMTRAAVRDAVATLLARGSVEHAPRTQARWSAELSAPGIRHATGRRRSLIKTGRK